MTIETIFKELRQNMMYLGLVAALTAGCGNNELNCPDGTQKEQKQLFQGGNMEYCMNDNGKAHGPAVRRYPNGAVEGRLNFVDGKASGKFQAWYENGNIAVEGVFVDDNLDGLMEVWNEKEVKITEIEFQKGKLHGKFRTWYDNGQLHERGECKEGQPDGEWTIKYENGTVVYGPAPADLQMMRNITGKHKPCDSSQILTEICNRLLLFKQLMYGAHLSHSL